MSTPIRAKHRCRRRSTYDFVLVQASEDGFTGADLRNPENSALIISFTSATSRTLRLGGFAVNTDKIQRNPEQI
jgi:hypothetical protein